jgi:hypothetical protein
MLDHVKCSYIRSRVESLRDWERFQGLVSDLLLVRIQVNSREGESQAKEDTSYRPVTRKFTLPELHNRLPGLDCLLRHKQR